MTRALARLAFAAGLSACGPARVPRVLHHGAADAYLDAVAEGRVARETPEPREPPEEPRAEEEPRVSDTPAPSPPRRKRR